MNKESGPIKRMNWLLLPLLLFLLIACNQNQNTRIGNPKLAVGQGKLSVEDGNIWYTVTGTGDGIPLVLLHGGPGSSSFYLKPFEDLGNDRQVIRYDQLGSGKSDPLTDTSLFTIEHFVEDLDSLRKFLGIKKWNVLGHSFGTIIAIEYYKAFPDRVSSLTFASACFDIPAFANHARDLLNNLPDSLEKAIIASEASGDFQNPLYQAAVNNFTSLYLVRKPVQSEIDSIMATYNGAMYYYMQGPSEFTITGTLKNYDITTFLPQIKVPTIFTAGEFDEVGPEIVKSFANQVPGSKYIEFPGSAHITIWDARDENVKVVRDFLLTMD